MMARSPFWKIVKLDKLTVEQLNLTANQIKYIDRFLVTSTRQLLELLETTFMLHIDSSDSNIKIMPTTDIEKIECLNSGPLYIIPSEMTGELQGNLHLLMRLSDVNNLGEVLKPTFEFLSLSSPDLNLATLEGQNPSQTQENNKSNTEDSNFHEQLMDALTEMGNSIFGIYTNALYETYDLYTHHSSLRSLRDSDQRSIQQVLSSPKMLDKQHFVIQNELSVLNNDISMCCLISPAKKSFDEILNRVG